jgi:tripartite ATP-independent transporter DctP family solute receptor
MKKHIAIIISIVLVLGMLSGCSKTDSNPEANKGNNAGVQDVVKLRVAIGATADSALGQGVEYFGKVLDEKSGGKIKVELNAGSVLGGDREVIEGVGLGTIEMCNIATGPISNFAEKFLPLDLPYVVTDRETAYGVLDGEMGREILDSLENSGIYGMSFWELGFRDLYNTKKIIEHPDDLEGLKIRVMENDIYISLFNGLGAYATPMSIGEVFTALQQGTIDGHDNPIGPTLTGKFYEADKNCTKTHHAYSATVNMINRKFFDSLPEEYQQWIIEADEEARDYERKLVLDEENQSYEAWKEAGGTVTEVDMDEWAKASSFIIDSYKDKVNMDLINAFKSN